MTVSTGKIIVVILVSGALMSACGGGGGGGGNDNGGGDGTTASTYTVDLTTIEMIDSQTGQPVSPTGLPISGATVTRN